MFINSSSSRSNRSETATTTNVTILFNFNYQICSFAATLDCTSAEQSFIWGNHLRYDDFVLVLNIRFKAEAFCVKRFFIERQIHKKVSIEVFAFRVNAATVYKQSNDDLSRWQKPQQHQHIHTLNSKLNKSLAIESHYKLVEYVSVANLAHVW